MINCPSFTYHCFYIKTETLLPVLESLGYRKMSSWASFEWRVSLCFRNASVFRGRDQFWSAAAFFRTFCSNYFPEFLVWRCPLRPCCSGRRLIWRTCCSDERCSIRTLHLFVRKVSELRSTPADRYLSCIRCFEQRSEKLSRPDRQIRRMILESFWCCCCCCCYFYWRFWFLFRLSKRKSRFLRTPLQTVFSQAFWKPWFYLRFFVKLNYFLLDGETLGCSTMFCSTIHLVLFDNWRIGRF